MNKLGIVLGAAAVAIVAGCMDPNYVRPNTNVAQNEVTPAAGEPTTPVLTPDVKPVADEDLPGYPGNDAPAIDISVAPVASCQCPPGAVHEGPCTCGAPDCKCAVVPPPPPQPPQDVVPAEQPSVADNTTVYVVRPGDTLFLISKRFNVKLDSIRKANPQVKNDNIRAGQKITLPAKVELGRFAEPPQQPTPPKKEFVPYTGPTVEYVVQNGDCVSRLAANNGLTQKQFMTLNNLTDTNIRIGQKVLLPAKSGAPAPAAPVAQPVVEEKKVVPAAKVEPVVEVPVVAEPEIDDIPVVEPPVAPVEDAKVAPPPPPAPAADPNGDYISYVVMKGEDITALSISFGIDPSVIREINNMGDDDQVVPGQTIRLPADAQ